VPAHARLCGCSRPRAGCGQHSPLAQARLQALDKHLRQLRATEAAANHRRRLRQASIGGNSSSSSSSSSASSTSHGRQVVAAELRVGAVYNLKGVGTREAAIIEKQLVPAAIRVLQRYLKVGAPGAVRAVVRHADGTAGVRLRRPCVACVSPLQPRVPLPSHPAARPQVLRPEGPPRVSSAFYSDNSQGGCIISKASPALAAGARSRQRCRVCLRRMAHTWCGVPLPGAPAPPTHTQWLRARRRPTPVDCSGQEVRPVPVHHRRRHGLPAGHDCGRDRV
jgi:hypothetical protein